MKLCYGNRMSDVHVWPYGELQVFPSFTRPFNVSLSGFSFPLLKSRGTLRVAIHASASWRAIFAAESIEFISKLCDAQADSHLFARHKVPYHLDWSSVMGTIIIISVRNEREASCFGGLLTHNIGQMRLTLSGLAFITEER